MKWPKGTAKAYYEGMANAKDLIGGYSVDELVRHYVGSIVEHLFTMDLTELEREVLMLEEETYGRKLDASEESLAVIRETTNRLANAILNAPRPMGGRKVKDGQR